MVAERGVMPYRVASKTDKFTLTQKNKKIDLEITHDFFSELYDNGNPHQEKLAAQITVRNVGDVNLRDVKVYIDLDDDMPAFDAQVSHTEQPPSGSLGGKEAVLHFRDLAVGATSSKRTYWWTVVRKFPGAVGSKPSKIRFNLYPTFTVDYHQKGEVFVSEANMAKG